MCFRRFLYLAFTLFADATLASVLAIDYGSHSIKVSLMKPGVPFDVVLDRDSKRKILAAVGWKVEERMFGADAINIATRYPSDVFPYLKIIQGGALNSASSSFHATLFPYLKAIETSRHTYSFQRLSGIEYTTEELIAMQFSYVKELAEAVAGGERITDAIVTVPGYYSQFERQAVIDSVAIAGMRVISLINDGMAIAVNFAMTRTFIAPETHVIYDVGASGIRATVVKFSTTTPPSSLSSSATGSKATVSHIEGGVTHIDVKGYGFDRSVGGLMLDWRLRDMIVDDFESKHGLSLKGESRALAKLWKDIPKIKAILSTNPATRISIESFLGDMDLHSYVSRSSFEGACEDLRPLFVQPILDAVQKAGLDLDGITSVIMAGGSSRTPMLQSAIKVAVGEEKITQYVNVDEAAVLGAAFYGATLSRQFKTKEIRIHDLLADYDIQVTYSAEAKPGRTINTIIFPSYSKLASKKTFTLKRKDDFVLSVAYKRYGSGGTPLNIFEAKVLGITDAMANLTSQGVIDPVVKLTMALSESGMITVQEALAFGELKGESVANGFFEPSSISSSSTAEPSTFSPNVNPISPTVNVVATTIPLKIEFRPLSIPPLSSAEKTQFRARIIALDKAELARSRKEEARNHLEGYLYRLRDLLNGESTDPFIEFSKEEERKTLSEQMHSTMAWMSDHGDIADTIEFWEKRNLLEQMEKPIQNRYQEAESGPKAYSDLQQALVAGRIFLYSARENATIEHAQGSPPKYSSAELAVIEAKLIEDEHWLKKNVEIQKQQKKSDDPVLLAAEMKARGVTLQNQVMKMLKRELPKKGSTTTLSSPVSELVAESETPPVTSESRPNHVDL